MLKTHIAGILQIQQSDVRYKFLGLPTEIPRSKKEVFNAIKVRISNLLTGWKEKLLSKAYKEVLVKSVATDILVYAMSCFRLTSDFVNSLIV